MRSGKSGPGARSLRGESRELEIGNGRAPAMETMPNTPTMPALLTMAARPARTGRPIMPREPVEVVEVVQDVCRGRGPGRGSRPGGVGGGGCCAEGTAGGQLVASEASRGWVWG